MTKTKIEWAEWNWNPLVGVGGGWGCNKVSPGCDHCYAEILHKRFGGQGDYGSTEHQFKINEKILEQPLKRKKPTRYFVCSTMDLFHHNVTDEMIYRMVQVMVNCPRHQFLVLTKRPERMKKYAWPSDLQTTSGLLPNNIWLGVSAENQEYWDKRVPILMSIPAVVHFVSAEPLIGPITDITKHTTTKLGLPEWVIIGGESGHGCREMKMWWATSLVEQCLSFSTPKVFVKQLGGYPDKRNRMEEFPEELRVREFPNANLR